MVNNQILLSLILFKLTYQVMTTICYIIHLNQVEQMTLFLIIYKNLKTQIIINLFILVMVVLD